MLKHILTEQKPRSEYRIELHSEPARRRTILVGEERQYDTLSVQWPAMAYVSIYCGDALAVFHAVCVKDEPKDLSFRFRYVPQTHHSISDGVCLGTGLKHTSDPIEAYWQSAFPMITDPEHFQYQLDDPDRTWHSSNTLIAPWRKRLDPEPGQLPGARWHRHVSVFVLVTIMVMAAELGRYLIQDGAVPPWYLASFAGAWATCFATSYMIFMGHLYTRYTFSRGDGSWREYKRVWTRGEWVVSALGPVGLAIGLLICADDGYHLRFRWR